MLVPQIAGAELEDLRTAARVAVQTVVASDPDVIVVIAATSAEYRYDGRATFSWHGFGVGNAPSAPPAPVLPWQLGLGAWLIDDAGWRGARSFVGVRDASVAPPQLEQAGLLVLGDGSARGSERAPGHFDDRAAAWDRKLADLLATGDAVGIRGIDSAHGRDLLSPAAITFPVAAAACTALPRPKAEIGYDASPYGVGYFVATWRFD